MLPYKAYYSCWCFIITEMVCFRFCALNISINTFSSISTTTTFNVASNDRGKDVAVTVLVHLVDPLVVKVRPLGWESGTRAHAARGLGRSAPRHLPGDGVYRTQRAPLSLPCHRAGKKKHLLCKLAGGNPENQESQENTKEYQEKPGRDKNEPGKPTTSKDLELLIFPARS